MLYKPKHKTDTNVKFQQAISNARRNLELLKECDKEAQQNNTLVGRYFTLPVNDGRAFYQVTKVSGKKCTVKLCNGICLDEYSDTILGEGYALGKDKVEEMVNCQKALDTIFKTNRLINFR